jgi:hypothetical protein
MVIASAHQQALCVLSFTIVCMIFETLGLDINFLTGGCLQMVGHLT